MPTEAISVPSRTHGSLSLPESEADRQSDPLARVIALYLPQFHPVPENDLWWGPGFTEWTNVAKARPLFRGHRQPRLPADLGFYDLRVPETRVRQAELARAAGIEAFCYWHYWFGNGSRILERPFEEVRDSGSPDFPFCLAWANQSWTGIWHGSPKSVLMQQTYPGAEDRERHFRWAQQAFEDHRYVTVEGRPLFVVYAPHDLPSTAEFVDHWRELAAKAGYPGLFLVAITDRPGCGPDMYHHPMLDPFDAVTPLVPQDYLDSVGRATRSGDLRRRVRERNLGRFDRFKPASWARPTRIQYEDVVRHALRDMPEGERFLPSVLPGWDNTPRSNTRGVVYEGETPELFRQYLQRAVDRVSTYRRDHRIVFLKAWNEWAEGNYVEPDSVNGHAYLDVIGSVLHAHAGQQVR